jgi:hypothetical protein
MKNAQSAITLPVIAVRTSDVFCFDVSDIQRTDSKYIDLGLQSHSVSCFPPPGTSLQRASIFLKVIFSVFSDESCISFGPYEDLQLYSF